MIMHRILFYHKLARKKIMFVCADDFLFLFFLNRRFEMKSTTDRSGRVNTTTDREALIGYGCSLRSRAIQDVIKRTWLAAASIFNRSTTGSGSNCTNNGKENSQKS